MKILYSGMQHFPGTRDFLFEHLNFYLSLAGLREHDIHYLPLDPMREIGFPAMSERIKREVLNQKPDIFILNVNTRLDKEILRSLKDTTKTILVGISTDDDTDFVKTKFWGPCFDYFVTFYQPVVARYQSSGTNVVGMNYAANTDFFRPFPGAKKDIEISFVGAAKAERIALIEKLKRRGVDVQCFGSGWPSGVISHEDILKVFNRSRINLNLAQGKPILQWQTLARVFVRPLDGGGFSFNPMNIPGNIRTILNRRNPQFRARPYEITACGGFCITNRAAAFGEPFVEDGEIVYFDTTNDLVKKIEYYLAHPTERERIAKAGYARTTEYHSFQRRFRELIELVGRRGKS